MLTPAATLTDPPSAPAPADRVKDPPREPEPPLEPAAKLASPAEPDMESPVRTRRAPDAPDTVLPLPTDTAPEEKPATADALWTVTDPLEPSKLEPPNTLTLPAFENEDDFESELPDPPTTLMEPPSTPEPADTDTEPPRLPAPRLVPTLREMSPDDPASAEPVARRIEPLRADVLEREITSTPPLAPDELEPPASSSDPPVPPTEEPPSTDTAPPAEDSDSAAPP